MKKIWIVPVVVLVAVLIGIVFYYGEGFEGRFRGTTSLKTKTSGSSSSSSAETLLTLSGGSAKNTVTLSAVDFDYDYDETDPYDTDPTWFSAGKLSMSYAAEVSGSGTLRININDGSATFKYQDWSDDMFADMRLQHRDEDGDFIAYINNKDSSFYEFDLSGIGADENDIFLLDVQAKEDANSSYMDKKLYIYLKTICVSKSGSEYCWQHDNGFGKNNYFKATMESDIGINIGWVKVQN